MVTYCGGAMTFEECDLIESNTLTKLHCHSVMAMFKKS